ncbi:MAG: toprim domain-containing protein, partial [Treponema sp.]|nr:toprim domain-containing protein [Treponema sp.]
MANARPPYKNNIPSKEKKRRLLMSVFDEVNELSAEMVLSRINLSLARDGKSYVCPLCGNGATGDPRHGHGDGIKPRTSKGRVRWKCHKCGRDFSNFDLAAATLGLDSEKEPAESARRVSELFGINESGKTFSFSREKIFGWKAWTPEQRAALSFEPKGAIEMDEKKLAFDGEPKNYSKFYEVNRANVDTFLAERGGSFRGLTLETFEKYGVVVHPEFGVEGHEKRPHLIIPYDDTHFTARAVVGHDKSQHGANSGLYEPLPIRNTDEPYSVNFIVEGEIDALSIAQVFGEYEMIGCVATGGASKYRKVVPELEKRFANAERKPSFIVMFDNDTAGKTNGLKLANDLKAAGYPTELFFLEENIAGEHKYQKSDCTIETFIVKKIDANDLLQRGEDKLIGRLIDGIDQTEWKLKAQAEAMKKSAEQARQVALDKSGMKISSFTEYFAADFFSDIALTAKYSERKTGFKNIDAAAQVFMPGLYVLGALPATGKTTFAWQLLNQLAEKGEPCIYCSYEMSRAELFTKSIARELYKRYPKMSERLNLSSVNIRRGACRENEELISQAAAFARSSTNLRVAELSNTGIVELIEKLKPLVADVD